MEYNSKVVQVELICPGSTEKVDALVVSEIS
jgi:hypothetical protein